MTPELLHNVKWESVVTQTDSFPNAFFGEDIVHGYDIVTFEGLQADANLFRKNQSNKKNHFNVTA